MKASNIRFPGQYYDEETGLHYNYHRYYDPQTGRYLRADPIGLNAGINLFVYSGNNPINRTDKVGLYDHRSSSPEFNDWYDNLSEEDYGYHGYDPPDLSKLKKKLSTPEQSAIRTAIQVADILPIPSAKYQIPMEVGAFVTTFIDIWVADVNGWRKAGAVAVNFYGLGGSLQIAPYPKTILLGTCVDISAFIFSAMLLGEDNPLDPINGMFETFIIQYPCE